MSLTPLAFLFLLAGYPTAPEKAPQDPPPPACSNTGTKRSSDAQVITTGKTQDCNQDGAKECGYEEILFPAIFECSSAGSMRGSCCKTYVDFVQKRVFFCDGAACVATAWANGQPFTQAVPEACVNGQNSSECTR